MSRTPMGAQRLPLSALQQQVTALHMDGHTDEAVDLAFSSREQYPERRALMALWLAEVHQRLRHDQAAALAELEEALANGSWWAETLLRAQPFLRTLAGNPDFEELVVQAEAMRRSAQLQAGPVEPTVYTPNGSKRGLLLVLHGRTGRLPQSATPWKPATDEGFVVAVPCSSCLSSSDGTFDWPDSERALGEVRSFYSTVVDEYELTDLPLILCGLSRGGRLSIAWCLSQALAAVGFIAVCPVMRDRSKLAPHAGATVERDIRGTVLVGQWDWAKDETDAVCQDLRRSGVNVPSKVMEGVDHGYPLDFAERLRSELAFILPPGT